MQYICSVGPTGPGGEVKMMPAKLSFSGVKPAVDGGYATPGLDAEPGGPMKPLTPWPGPVPSRRTSVGTSARGSPGGSVGVADTDAAKTTAKTALATTIPTCRFLITVPPPSDECLGGTTVPVYEPVVGDPLRSARS